MTNRETVREAQREPQRESKGDLTSMIDVTFLLLVFFIVTLKFRTLEGRLDAHLPRDLGISDSPLEMTKLRIVVTVADEGQRIYELGMQRFGSLAALAGNLEPFVADGSSVVLDLRQGTIYEDAIALLDTVILAGFEKISFSAAANED